MRILKYIFLIFLVVVFAVTTLTATQNGQYTVKQTVVVAPAQETVRGFLSDFYQWEQWYTDAPNERTYSSNSVGKGATMSWSTALREGRITNIASTPSLLKQDILEDDIHTALSWSLQQTKQGTKILLEVSGELTFSGKLKALLQGGIKPLMEDHYQTMLQFLKSTLEKEISAYAIQLDGYAELKDHFYIGQSIASTSNEVNYNINILMSRMTNFFRKNKMTPAGHPYIVTSSSNQQKGVILFTACMPVADEIWVSPESDVQTGLTLGGNTIRATVTGDYSHLPEARKKIRAFITEKNLTPDPDRQTVEVYKVNKSINKSPSKWVTEIYFPIVEGRARKKATEEKENNSSTAIDSLGSLPESENKLIQEKPAEEKESTTE